MDPTKNGGTVRIFIGGDWIQLKTVVLSEYLLEETGSKNGSEYLLEETGSKKTVVLSEYLLEETGSN